MPLGSPAINQKDFFFQVSSGQVTGYSASAMGANNPNMQSLDPLTETIWTQGGTLNVLTANTQLYASSTSAGDTATIFIFGVDDSFNSVVRLVTLNGQNQVALSGLMMILNTSSTTANCLGDVYIAESDTLTGGKPNTASKIQMKINAGENAGNNAIFAIPAGKSGYFYELSGTSSKGKDVKILLKFKIFGLPMFIQAPKFNVFESQINFNMVDGSFLPEKTIVLLEAQTSDTGASITAGIKFILF